jgi:hypothetical protein
MTSNINSSNTTPAFAAANSIHTQEGGADAFDRKMTELATLISELSISEARCQPFWSIAAVTSGLFGAALEDKSQRVEQRRQQILTAKPHAQDTEERLLAVEGEESALLSKRIDTAAREIDRIGSLVRTVLYYKLSSCGRTDEERTTFIADARAWLSRSQTQHNYRFDLEFAKSLLENNDISGALKVLVDLSPLFSADVKQAFKTIEKTTSEQEAAAAHSQFLLNHQDKIVSSLTLAEQNERTPRGWSDLLQHKAIVEALLKYLSPSQLGRAVPNWRELTAESFPIEYLNAKAPHVLTAPSFSLSSAPRNCRDMDSVAINAMIRNGLEYHLLSERLRGNILIIKLAILSVLKTSPENLAKLLEQIPADLRRSESITTFIGQARDGAEKHRGVALINGWGNYTNLVKLCPNDKDICRLAVKVDGMALELAGPELRNNLEIVKLVVQQDGRALQYAGPELRNNSEIVKLAVRQCWQALRFAGDELRNNPEIVRLAVRQDGRALQYAGDELRNNPEIVGLAVQQDWQALAFASPELRNNPEIVKLAVQQCWQALALASPELRNNPEIVGLALQQDGWALAFVGPELRNDPRFAWV